MRYDTSVNVIKDALVMWLIMYNIAEDQEYMILRFFLNTRLLTWWRLAVLPQWWWWYCVHIASFWDADI